MEHRTAGWRHLFVDGRYCSERAAGAAGFAECIPHPILLPLLVARGASIDAADSSSRTPLHYAAMAGHVETAGRLIIAGAGVHKLDCNGYTPAHHAAMKGHAEVRCNVLTSTWEVEDGDGDVQRCVTM